MLINLTAGGSQEQLFNPQGRVSEEVDNYTGANESGTWTDSTTDWTAGGSTTYLFTNLPTGDFSAILNYTGANDSGQLSTESVTQTNGGYVNYSFSYNGAGTATSYLADAYNGSGSLLGWADFNPNGGYIDGSGDVGNSGSEYVQSFNDDDEEVDDYGFAGSAAVVAAAVASPLSSIAQTDIANGDTAGAAGAQVALAQVQTVIAAGTTSPVLTGAQWTQPVITWSIAAPSGSADSQFNGAMDSAEQAAVAQAFATWGAATGLDFEEVSGSTQSDIQVGLADFDTASTAVVGYTTTQSAGGQLQSAVVQLEDPSEDSLVTGPDGQTTYAGTQATFEQALLHEIGHAVGFADNANPTSVMSYYLGGGNQTLSATDQTAAGALYGPPNAALLAQAQSLINAAAAFSPAGAATVNAAIAVNSNDAIQLAANGH